MSDTIDEFLLPKHKRLLWIANIIQVLAWVILVVNILRSCSQIIYLQIIYRINGLDGLISMFKNMAKTYIIDFLDVLGVVLVGLIWWFVLRGISLGLKMVVETDLNYRENVRGFIDG